MIDEQITAHYPSGHKVKIFGRFFYKGKLQNAPGLPYRVAIQALESETNFGQQISPGSIAVLDPRCVVVGDQSGVLYNPRRHCDEFEPAMQKWMADNPDWPERLEQDTK